jgi:diguanylate cyclase (GGDEF)-like protein
MQQPDPPVALDVSPVADQLRRGFRWLRFAPELETAYQQEQYSKNQPYLRVNLGVGLLVVVAVTLLDRLVLRDSGDALMDVARYAALLPAIAIALTVTFLKDGRRLYRPVVSVLAPIAMVAIVVLVLAAPGHGEGRLFTVLILVGMFIYFLVGLPFLAAVAANLISLAAYVYGGLALATPSQELTYNALMLLLAIGVGAAVAYNAEHTRRTVWLETRLLDQVAQRDGLTGIYNRRRFDEHLTRVWQQGAREHRPITLLLADIDYFKAFNDRYGHQAGDEALKRVAAVLAQATRRPLDLAARYGGEEFAIVLFDTKQDHAERVADQVMEGVRELGIPHQDSGAAPVLTISVGIACVMPMARRSPAGLVQLADQALYAAKDAGRNRSRLLQAEYEHMKTGYFRRHIAGDGEPRTGQ